MQKILTCIILYTVSEVVCEDDIFKNYTIERNHSNVAIAREKQQEDISERWLWDVFDNPINQSLRLIEVTSSTTSTTTSTTEQPPPPVCDPYNPETPDYRAPGRRISEAKCLEYIWQLNLRKKIFNRKMACEEERLRKLFPGQDFLLKGYTTKPGDYPHMGAIGWKAAIGTWVFMCGSTLISPNFVLTAAHCTLAADSNTMISDPVPKIVRLGDKNILDVMSKGYKPNDVNIARSIVHPLYRPPKKYYDIALMELAERVNFTRLVQPACLWPKFDTSSLGTEATITGWGVVEVGSRTTSPELQAGVIDIIDTPTCHNLLNTACNRLWCGIRNHQMCAGKLTGGTDTCQGDSGGPLQVKIELHDFNIEGAMHYVVGVTSFGIGCGHVNTPGVYSRVSSFVDWIEPIVWP